MPLRRSWMIVIWLGLAAIPTSALAHDGRPPAPHDLASAWSWEPTILFGITLLVVTYLRGLRVLWRRAGIGRGVRRGQALAFAGGSLSLFVALVSPLDALGSALFSAHMVQHLLLILGAAPLLVLSSPQVALLWALPLAWRRSLGRWWQTHPFLHSTRHLLTLPLLVWVFHAVALWMWHIPQLYDTALRSELIHALKHASFIGTALLFWWILIHPGTSPNRLSYGAGVLFVFAMAVQSSLLGALMTFARAPWYRSHATSVAEWGLSALEDQQLAGLIMWVPGGVGYLLAAALLFIAWLHSVERAVRRRERLSVDVHDVAAS